MTRTRPTIKDIAQAAGVGVVTVSRALNDRPDVSQATRERILKIADSMGYRPNRHARFLKMEHNPSIALMMKGIDNPFFQPMLDTMEEIVRQNNYLLTVVKVPHWADEVEEAIKLVDEDLMAGVIFLGGAFSHEASAFERVNVPFVLSTVSKVHGVPDGVYSSVSVDDELEAAQAVRHLVDLGHRHIAVLGVPESDVSVGARRVRGYEAAMEASGIAVDPRWVRSQEIPQYNPYSYEYGYRLTVDLLRENPEVTAIFAIADTIAIGAMRAIREAGLTVPDDISIIGFDGISIGEYIEPPLTTLVQPSTTIAQLTCEVLFRQIASGPVQHVFVPGDIYPGGSTAPPRRIGSPR
ncbi:LacI family DNA-binding transcriptional regulator [Schaalia sp. ZJ405]|uniref:LacI family DNA-binding transcriptional regulator n=1 Tax=Schaalia sp. ZJ405 TaxID=2709403 RepID=UPI0013EC0773|nr:LacI family DNA-binding transcriptional regulator [Schaalia sp. ZJ405]QPK80718.1 LacI family DNA-binding transcriptional regulator [Schaalia sp. ZJ405]